MREAWVDVIALGTACGLPCEAAIRRSCVLESHRVPKNRSFAEEIELTKFYTNDALITIATNEKVARIVVHVAFDG